MDRTMGGPLGEDQQGVPLSPAELAKYRARQAARLGHPPKTEPTDAERRQLAADVARYRADRAAADEEQRAGSRQKPRG